MVVVPEHLRFNHLSSDDLNTELGNSSPKSPESDEHDSNDLASECEMET